MKTTTTTTPASAANNGHGNDNETPNSGTEAVAAEGNTVTEDAKQPDDRDWIPVFVNEGLARWEESRASWLGKQQQQQCSDDSNSTSRAAVPLDVDEVIDLIFSQRWRHPERSQTNFSQPVPLPQMVDILIDLWEAEGLDM